MARDDLLAKLASLRQAPVDQKRAPHKPLLLLWLFGQFQGYLLAGWAVGVGAAQGAGPIHGFWRTMWVCCGDRFGASRRCPRSLSAAPALS